MNLSTNFTLTEFTKSATADRYGIPNVPVAKQIAAMKNLCTIVLEPLRAKLRKKVNPNAIVIISSGFRSIKLNAHKSIGGAKTSQHPEGEAVDIRIEDGNGNRIMTPSELFDFIVTEKIPYDQLIWEFGQWVHISYKLTNVFGMQRRAAFYIWLNKAGEKQATADKPEPGEMLNNSPTT